MGLSNTKRYSCQSFFSVYGVQSGTIRLFGETGERLALITIRGSSAMWRDVICGIYELKITSMPSLGVMEVDCSMTLQCVNENMSSAEPFGTHG